MKTKLWLSPALVVALGLGSAQIQAAAPAAPKKAPAAAKAKPAPPAPARSRETNVFPAPLPAAAKQAHVNVRGQAAMTSEVVARLTKGQRVEVLEEITLKKPKADEPDKWYRIALPTNAPVWVSALYLDAGLAVKVPRLNLRAGPGENFSVLGRVEKGAAFKELERKGEWIRVEPPAGSGAYVAAHLVSLEPAGAVVAAVKPVVEPKPVEPVAPPKPAVVVVAPPPVTPPPPLIVATTAPPVVVAAAAPIVEPKPPVVEPPPLVVVPPPVTPPAAVLPAASNITVAAAADAATNAVEEILPKRIVTREGLLQGSVSIQAPSYFELRSPETHRIIDYVFTADTNIVLKKFKGMKVLLVGEESLDERWPHTPVLTVESVEKAR